MLPQPTEEWRTIPSLDGKYAVSNRGRVKRQVPGFSTFVGRVLKASPSTTTGYPIITYGKPIYVHRLVAEAFLPPRPTLDHEINHRDGDPTNNNVENLEWVTHQENILHARRVLKRMGAQGQRHGRAKLCDADVYAIRSVPKSVQHVVLARKYNVSPATIESIRCRRTWRHL